MPYSALAARDPASAGAITTGPPAHVDVMMWLLMPYQPVDRRRSMIGAPELCVTTKNVSRLSSRPSVYDGSVMLQPELLVPWYRSWRQYPTSLADDQKPWV